MLTVEQWCNVEPVLLANSRDPQVIAAFLYRKFFGAVAAPCCRAIVPVADIRRLGRISLY